MNFHGAYGIEFVSIISSPLIISRLGKLCCNVLLTFPGDWYAQSTMRISKSFFCK